MKNATQLRFEERYDEIMRTIASGELKRALELTGDLTTIFKDEKSRVHNTLLHGRFNQLNFDYSIANTIADEAYKIETNKITRGLTELLPLIEKQFLVTDRMDQEVVHIPGNKARIIFSGKGIEKSFDNFTLSEIDFELSSSKILALVGENGSGKSTLMDIIAGRIPVDAGELNFLDFPDQNWYHIKQSIAYVSQFVPEWTWNLVDTLVYYGMIRGGLSPDAAEKECEYLISRLGLNGYESNYWSDLSGGYKTRFELARALICKPKILILDEPLAHLSPLVQSEFLQSLKDACALETSPLAVLISTQHINEVETITDDVLVLDGGRTKYYGERNAIVSKEQTNALEIKCNLTTTDLASLLEGLNKRILVERVGTVDKITFPITIHVNEVLAFLLSKGHHIDYLRDITNSSKRLIYKSSNEQ